MISTSRRSLLGATLAFPLIRPAFAAEKLQEIRLDCDLQPVERPDQRPALARGRIRP
jgi:hypothetical protein